MSKHSLAADPWPDRIAALRTNADFHSRNAEESSM
jgi:hypothetical protein